jgi:hypothetical protein
MTSWPSGLRETRAPRCSSTAIAVRMSASTGTFRSTHRSRVSSVEKSSGSAAFFEPLTTTSPFKIAPPRMTIVSTSPPPQSTRSMATTRTMPA